MDSPSGDLDVPAGRDRAGFGAGYVKVDPSGAREALGGRLAAEEREARDLGPGALSPGAGCLERRALQGAQRRWVPLLQTELEDMSAMGGRHSVEDAKSGRGHRFGWSERNVSRGRALPVCQKLVVASTHVNRRAARTAHIAVTTRQ